jgi:RNA polymerase sigma-70 factor (ECF subfamily)
VENGLEDNNAVCELDLLRHAQGRNEDALNEVLIKHRDRLKRMISVRMNQKLQSRIDASDVIQDTFIEASRALNSYLENPKMPVFIWLRHLAGQKLIQAHRLHLGAHKRAAGREQRIFGGAPQATSQSMAIQLAGSITSPSQAAEKNEAKDRLMAALDSMDEIDREILTLRHFEHLSSRETAEVVGMNHEAVRKRYIRALDKMQRILAEPS